MRFSYILFYGAGCEWSFAAHAHLLFYLIVLLVVRWMCECAVIASPILSRTILITGWDNWLGAKRPTYI